MSQQLLSAELNFPFEAGNKFTSPASIRYTLTNKFPVMTSNPETTMKRQCLKESDGKRPQNHFKQHKTQTLARCG